MPRNRTANLVGTITGTSLNVASISLSSGLNVASQVNDAYAQANAAYGQANAAYGQANLAYTAANTKLAAAGGTITGDLTVSGNLFVEGTTTTLNVSNLEIEDNDIVLNANTTGTPSLNATITIDRGTSTNTFLRWNENADKWGWSDDGTTMYNFSTSLDAYGQANTAYTQANNAYGQANSAFSAANNRVLKAGDTMTGQLNISTGGLLVTGNVNIDSGTLFVDTINDSIGIGTANPARKLDVRGGMRLIQDAVPTTGALVIRQNVSDNVGGIIQFVNHLNTVEQGWISSDTNGDLKFATLSTEKMRIDANGNIGVGTSSPSNFGGRNLQISNTTIASVIWTNDTYTGQLLASASAEVSIASRSNHPLRFGTNDTERMRLDTSGNLLLGTSSNATGITTRFLTKSLSDYAAAAVFESNGSAANWARTDWKNANIATSGIIYMDQNGEFAIRNDGNYPLSFYTNGGNRRMIITGAGNVGIGTTSIAAKLHVHNTNFGTGTVASLWQYSGSASSPTEVSDWPYPVLSLRSYGNFYLQTMLSFGLPNDADYKTDDSVWNFRLNGVTASGWDNNSNTTPSIASSANVGLQLLGPGNLRLGTVNSKNIYFRTNNSDVATIDGSGNVGIGTTGPGTKLTVSSATNAGISVTDGTVTTILYNTSSVNGTVGTTSNHPMAFYTNNAERMRIDSSGNVGIGGTASAFARIHSLGTLPTSSNITVANFSAGTIPSGATSVAYGYYSNLGTQAASFTCSSIIHNYVNPGTFGAGSAVSNQYGYYCDATLTGATSNFGFYSNIASGSNRWNFYAAGTARNYFAGRTDVGNTRIEATNNWSGVKIYSETGVSLADGATVTLTSTICGAVTINVYETASGDGGTFFANYSGTVTKLAGDGAATDTGSTFAVYKSAGSHTLTLKNKYGNTRGFRVSVIGAYVE